MKKRKVTAKLMAFGKKNTVFKFISLVLLAVYLFFYYAKQYCIQNRKRYACIFCACLIFAISSSFSFEGKELEGTVVKDGMDTEYDLPKEAVSSGSNMEEVAILEDKDVMEGYENSELEYVTEEDKFSIDEILTAGEGYLESVSENSTKGQLSIDDWQLVLINKHHSIPDDYTFTLGTIKGNMQCDERIIPELMEMLQAAKEDGVSLIICSPYRDLNRQKVLFERKIKAYMRKGYSYLEAYQISSQAVTVPGASEHQIGLAIDFLCKGYSSLNEGFEDTEGGRWLAEHSYEYGFVLRYPKGKEYITGIEYEPWHFRYVGREAAAIMTEEELTLEEFVEQIDE
ncbi:MAG: M15 family metallopeptidase [Lachnospiraceae bacterium]|nr:M15 family metallopeptidase [Lachnospiraceae bacterium]